MDTTTNSSVNPDMKDCVFSVSSRSVFTAWFSVYLLFLPVFLFVLYIGFNKWKKPQSSASGDLSHSDVFTLNMVAMEMASIIGSCVGCYGFYTTNGKVLVDSESVYITTYAGQTLFHSLTCVERYLAVVHPVTYLRLRREGGVTIRNISISVVWLFSVACNVLISFPGDPVVFGIYGLTLSTASSPVVAYCSIYVLCVLIRPKPGAGGGQKKQIDQSKRNTVYTAAAILAALLLRLMVFIIYGCMNFLFGKVNNCIVIAVSLWVALPSSLVLPLLFLHRAGRLLTMR